jgi:hypothetical protein
VAGAAVLATAVVSAAAWAGPEKPDFPKFEDVAKGYTKVISTANGQASLYTIFVDRKKNQMLAELPRGFERQKHFIAMTIASGDMWAGLQGGDRYVYWKRYDKRLALIAPEVGTRTTGDQESKSAVGRHFTDRVLLDVPIVCMGPSGQPVIDMDALLAGRASTFFGSRARGANAKLLTVQKAKAFPKNVEVAFEMPVSGGQLRTFHYSISQVPDRTGYKPRKADERLGYFVTAYRDLGKYQDEKKWIRYVNRWHLEKADPKLKMSPAKEPIVFYIEHTVPVRYRRFVRDGILYWNKAFEQVGLVGAIEVRYQDKATGAHMDKDPEDVLTGQILDADVVLTDGWIRHFYYQYHDLLPDVAMEGFSPETLAWLDENPNWDPRIRMAPPEQREYLLAQRQARGPQAFGGHPAATVDPTLIGDDEYDGLIGRVSQVNGMCLAARGKAMDMALVRMHMDMFDLVRDEQGEGEGGNGEDPMDLLDGVPDWFVGPMLADLVAHEVGHTLGLRHNFKASSLYSLEEINSDAVKGNKPFTASVMDYNPVNINMESGEVQGDYAMIDIGPYDMWVIEYGYTLDEPDEILKRVAEPELAYATDEDTWGPDPLARRYDFTAEPLDYAENQMRLVRFYRDRLLEKFVKDGQSWARSRQGYLLTLGQQTSMLSMMGNWIGGAYVYRDKKGDPDGRPPIEVVDAERQRRALAFVIDNAFADGAFGLTPDLLEHMTVDKWSDPGGRGGYFEDPTWPVHDRIMGIQASAMIMVMNPTTLRRVYDNEFRVPAEDDALTLPEMLNDITGAVYTELDTDLDGATYTNRQPMISSLRRNLQSELTDRLIDVALGTRGLPRSIQTLAMSHLKRVNEKIEGILDKADAGQVDEYTIVHLEDLNERIERALNAIQLAR